MRKLALSMRVTESQNYFEMRNSIAFEYISFFENLGFLVILIPNNTKNVKAYLEDLKIDGVVLSGGNNVNPVLYEGKEELSSVYPQRDDIEKKLVELAIEKKLPLLGICRGFQYINVHFGGSIVHNIEGHVKKDHILISANTFLENAKTNSYHNQAIYENNMSKELEVIAKTEDGVVEAISHNKHKILGLQWHPERHNIIEDKNLIQDFFNN